MRGIVTITSMFSLLSTIFLRSWIFIMKKLLTAGSLLGVLALAACGSGPEEEGAETEPGETETETETDSESTETEG